MSRERGERVSDVFVCVCTITALKPPSWLMLSLYLFISSSICLSLRLTIISPSVCSPVYPGALPHTRTSPLLLVYFSVIPSNTTLSSCLISKQGHNVSLHELPTVCGCAWMSHSQTCAHLSIPPGPRAQLSVSLIPFPSSLLGPLSSPPSRSSVSLSHQSHPFLIFSNPRLFLSFFLHSKWCMVRAPTGMIDF